MVSKKLVLELFSSSFNFKELGIEPINRINCIKNEFGDEETAKKMLDIDAMVGDCCLITLDELDHLTYALSSDKKHLSASCVNGNTLTKYLLAQFYVLVFEGEIIANRFTKEYFANVFLNEHNDKFAYDLIMNDNIIEFIKEYIEKFTLAL